MALVLPRSIFLHCPKSGGWWVRNAVAAAGLRTCEYGNHHTNFKNGLLSMRDADWYSRKLVFTFVRHPLNWYRSMWAFRMKYGWSMTHPLDYNCSSNDFQTFVRNALNWWPSGWVTRTFNEYTFTPPGVKLFVGRQETLQADLLSALTMAGEQFDRDVVVSTPPANHSNMDGRRPSELAVYDDELADRVLEVEREAVLKWYPNNLYSPMCRH